MTRSALPLLATLFVAVFACAPARADTYTVTLDASAASGPQTGRLMLFFITEQRGRWRRRLPMTGPFYDPPQPIFSVAVDALAPGESIEIDGAITGFPGSLNELDGPLRVQAVLDVDDTERAVYHGPGNLCSEPVEATVSSGAEDAVKIVVDRPTMRRRVPQETERFKWVRLRSPLLSAFYERDVFHIAGVALPPGYDEAEEAWPAVYVIPGFGGRAESAANYAQMFSSPGIEEVAPMAVHIVLDPESPLGHHGFVDSPNHGPRGTALVEELIPHLETRFRLVARPEARIVTGHSSGGWTSLWLQLSGPDVFGGCWASAPDPIDFSAFQMTDLYRDASMHVRADGSPTPSMRHTGIDGTDVVAMTVRQESRMEVALEPHGGSGEQWDAWEAMFSPRDPVTGYPQPLFDPGEGAIDRTVAEHWKKFDMNLLVEGDWPRYGPVVMEKVHLACGAIDSFYLNRAVERFKRTVDGLADAGGGWSGDGYILIVENATHGSVTGKVFQRWNEEMRAYFARHGLQAALNQPTPPIRPTTRSAE